MVDRIFYHSVTALFAELSLSYCGLENWRLSHLITLWMPKRLLSNLEFIKAITSRRVHLCLRAFCFDLSKFGFDSQTSILLSVCCG
jgi:hypothetical protein